MKNVVFLGFISTLSIAACSGSGKGSAGPSGPPGAAGSSGTVPITPINVTGVTACPTSTDTVTVSVTNDDIAEVACLVSGFSVTAFNPGSETGEASSTLFVTVNPSATTLVTFNDASGGPCFGDSGNGDLAITDALCWNANGMARFASSCACSK